MRLEFEYEEYHIKFDVIYKKRKTITINIDKDKNINVKAPIGVSSDYILDLVKRKSKWIIKKFYEIDNIKIATVNRDIKEGNTFLYLGKEYPIHIVFDEKVKSIKIFLKRLDNEMYLIIRTNKTENQCIKKALEAWYRERCLDVVSHRINYYQKYFIKGVKGFKVKEQKRQWASCTYDNRILFNWRSVMAPLEVIDYIVVHEMCHMDYKNHSKDFWNRVCMVMPDYKMRHKWLKDNGHKMNI